MSTYRIFLTSTASVTVQVEAETLYDAQELAYDETPSLCAHVEVKP